MGLTISPRAQRRVFRALKYEWRAISRKKLYRNIKNLEDQKIIRYSKKGKWWSIELTKKGREQAKKIGFNRLKISKPKKWDKKWRVVIFDIPEKKKIIRDALRRKIQELGFQELQKSVFVYPYSCFKEIETVTNFFRAKKFIKQFTVANFDQETEKQLRGIFKV